MKKKVLVNFFLMVCCISLFCGCKGGVNLSDRNIVKMLFVDKKDKEYTIGTVVYDFKANADTGTSEDTAQVFFGSGKTISEALNKAETIQNKKAFYGQNEILLLGGNAQKDVNEILTFFAKEEVSRPNMAVFVSDITAEKLKEQKDLTTLVSDFENIIKEKGESNKYAKMLFQCNFSEDKQFFGGLPCVKLSKTENEKMAVKSMQFYEKGQKQGFLNDEMSNIYNILADRSISYHFEGTCDGENFVCDITGFKKEFAIAENEGIIDIDLQISGTVRNLMAENALESLTVLQKEKIKKIINKELQKNAKSVIEKVGEMTSSDEFDIDWWCKQKLDGADTKLDNKNIKVTFKVEIL
ncbi:MAG: hypothetical protein RR902_01455 [Oscillospiraceae bacterium]